MNQTKVNLSDGQRKKLANEKQVNLRLRHENLVGNDTLLLAKRELNKLNKARESGKGVVVQAKGATAGGSLMGLAAAALPMAAKALGLAGLSFGAEKALKKIFGSGIPPQAIELGKLVELLSPAQKKMIKNILVGQGFVGAGQKGGFLGVLASLGIPLAISLVKKILGKGVTLQPSRGKGMQLQPHPPIVGTWGKKFRGRTFK